MNEWINKQINCRLKFTKTHITNWNSLFTYYKYSYRVKNDYFKMKSLFLKQQNCKNSFLKYK